MHEDFYYFIMPSRGVAIFSHPNLSPGAFPACHSDYAVERHRLKQVRKELRGNSHEALFPGALVTT